MKVYIQSKSGDHNAVIYSASPNLRRAFEKLSKDGGYYCYTFDKPPVTKFASLNEIEYIREATGDEIVDGRS